MEGSGRLLGNTANCLEVALGVAEFMAIPMWFERVNQRIAPCWV